MPELTHALITAEVERKMLAALERIEAAQRLLSSACAELSPIIGAVPAWERVGKLYDKVHAEWHRTKGLLVNRRGKFDLDETGRRALLRSLGLGEEAPRG